MDKTKTAVILGIVSIILLGGILYALKDNFTAKSGTSTSKSQVAE